MRLATTGFREYDARWRYPDDIDLEGMEAFGLALGTFFATRHPDPTVVCGRDYRSYAEEAQAALIRGLVRSGARVTNIGLALSPMAYFAQNHLGAKCCAMVTASHNPNGWTGVKMSHDFPLTLSPGDMDELRAIALGPGGSEREGGRVESGDVAEAYATSIAAGVTLTRKLRVVCATGNGTAGAFLPGILTAIGAEVIPLHTDLDWSFPHYNPNPERAGMLADMAKAVRTSGADIALGFDGDGDRVGVVDNLGREITGDKMGLILARHWAAENAGRTIIADVKSTGLFASDTVLASHGIRVEYGKTGHSYLKRQLRDLGAIAAFERSGHYYLGAPYGPGYDCAATAAVRILQLLDQNPSRALADLADDLPQTWLTPTLQPPVADTEKYAALADITGAIESHLSNGGRIGGHAVISTSRVSGLRMNLENGGFALLRASSNTPNLVIVCESPVGPEDLDAILGSIEGFVEDDPRVGNYDRSG